MGIFSILRRSNSALRKGDASPSMTPSIQQIATRLVQLKKRFPLIDILLSKRDIAMTFKLTPLHPNLMSCLCHFPRRECAKPLHISRDVFSHSIWLSGLSRFLQVSAISDSRNTSGLWTRGASRDLGPPYRSFLYVGDCTRIEPRVGSRPEDSVASWEVIREVILTPKRANKEKEELE